MSFLDEESEPAPMPDLLTDHERRLLAQHTWTVDELVSLAFLARRLAARVDRALGRKAHP